MTELMDKHTCSCRSSTQDMAEHEPPSLFDQVWSLIVLRSVADAVITSDADDRIRFLNPAAEALTGWSLEEAGGRSITEVFRLIDETTGRPIDWPRTEVLTSMKRFKMVKYLRAIEAVADYRTVGDGMGGIREDVQQFDMSAHI